MSESITANLAYLTGDAPGIGGVIKQRREDFLVEEQPLYEPAGEGEHVMLFIEKRGKTTSDLIRYLAKTFYVSRKDVGYAGMKDKHAVTRQHFTVYFPGPEAKEREAECLERINNQNFTLLWASRHHNKLRRGHLAGNRFVLRIREVDPTRVIAARDMLDQLHRCGVPNYLGDQRFGYRQNNHLLGRHLLLGQWKELIDEMLGHPSGDEREGTNAGREFYAQGEYEKAIEAWPRFLRNDRCALDVLRQGRSHRDAFFAIDSAQREFLISGLQSAMFNRILDQRVRQGTLDQLQDGDVARKVDNGALFAVDADIAAAENAPDGRMAKHEIAPTGPMWGPQMPRASAQVDQRELAALDAMGITQDNLLGCDPYVKIPDGTRRSLSMFLRDPDISGGSDEHGPYIRLAFELPRGSFATVVLRELMKVDDLEGKRGKSRDHLSQLKD